MAKNTISFYLYLSELSLSKDHKESRNEATAVVAVCISHKGGIKRFSIQVYKGS
jgi:hypothetical protein